jgi:hypothetical protein
VVPNVYSKRNISVLIIPLVTIIIIIIYLIII